MWFRFSGGLCSSGSSCSSGDSCNSGYLRGSCGSGGSGGSGSSGGSCDSGTLRIPQLMVSSPGFWAFIGGMSFLKATEVSSFFHADLSFSRSKLFDSNISNLHRDKVIEVS